MDTDGAQTNIIREKEDNKSHRFFLHQMCYKRKQLHVKKDLRGSDLSTHLVTEKMG